jgi:hypothetical protein
MSISNPFARELRIAARALWVLLLPALATAPLRAQEADLPPYLADRGPGQSTSLFGTYVEKGEILFYPFYEYVKSGFFEYQPQELGFSGGNDFRGKLVEHEYLLFFAYGISERLMIELEGAVYTTAAFERAPEDLSAVPRRLKESGLGDVETQLRWRWRAETAHRPELFSYAKVVFPLQKDKVLIGTSAWEGDLGFGAIRGFGWGTITARVALAYDGEDGRIEFGEYAVEYLKRLSPAWRMVATIEGETEDVSLIGEAQWSFSPRGFLKLNCGFGLTEKAPDIAPEVGVLLRF